MGFAQTEARDGRVVQTRTSRTSCDPHRGGGRTAALLRLVLFALAAVLFAPRAAFAQTITLSAPATSTTNVDTCSVVYSLSDPDAGAPQSVQLVWTPTSGPALSVGTSYTFTMKSNAISGSWSFKPTDLTNSANAFTASPTTPMTDGFYSVYALLIRNASIIGPDGGPATVKSTTRTNVGLDTITQPPSLYYPASGSSSKDPLGIGYVLAESYLSGSASLSFIQGSTVVNRLTLVDNTLSAVNTADAGPDATPIITGPKISTHFTNCDAGRVPAGDAGVADGGISSVYVVADTTSCIPDGVYSVTLSYQDRFSHPPATATSTNVTIDTVSQPATLTLDAGTYSTQSGATSPLTFGFTLAETPADGGITLLLTSDAGGGPDGGDAGWSFVLPNNLSANDAGVYSYTLSGAAVPEGAYSAVLQTIDVIGNGPTSSNTVTGIIVDNTTQPPTLTSPAASSGGTNFTVNYTLGETPLAGSVRITVGGALTLTVTNASSCATTTTCSFTWDGVSSSTLPSGVTSSSSSMTDGTYNVTVSYQDQFGNPVSSATNSGVTLERATSAPVFHEPTTGYVGGLIPIAYTLPVAAKAGTVSLTISGPVTYVLTMIDTSPGGTTYIDPGANPAGTGPYVSCSPSSPVGVWLPDGVYTLLLSYQDAYGNQSPPAVVTGVRVQTQGFSVGTLSVNGTAGTVSIPVSGGVLGASVDYTTVDGTAFAGADYTLTSGTLVWGVNASSTQYITVPLINDGTIHSNRTFQIRLSSPVGASIVTTYGTVTIIDNNVPPIVNTEPVVRVAGVTVSEAIDGGVVQVPITLTGTWDADVTVDWDTTDDTATSPTRYQSASGTLTWTAGTSGTKYANVNIVNYPIQTATTDFIVGLTSATNATIGTLSANVYITDTQSVGVAVVTGGATTVAEGGGTATFTVSLTSKPASDVTVTLLASSLIGASPSPLTFTQTNWSTPQMVTVTGPALGSLSSDQTATVAFSTSSSDPYYNALYVAPVSVSVTHVVLPSISVADVSVNKSSGLATVTVTMSGSNAAGASVNYETVDSTAVAGTDYGSTSGTLTWGASSTVSKTFTVAIDSASLTHGNVSFDIILSSATHATLGRSAATVTIIDNASASIVVTASDGGVSVVQGGSSSSFTVALGSAPLADVTVAMAAGGLVGFSPTSVRFTSVNWATPQSIAVTGPSTGTLTAGTTIPVAFSVTSTDSAYAGVAQPSLTVTITVPVAPPVATFAATSVSVNESAGTVSIPITGGVGNSSVQYTTVDGTATASVDYTSTSGTLTWGALESGSKSITVPLVNNHRNHPNRAFQVTLSNPVQGALIVSTATVTIVDDYAPPAVAVAGTTVSESAGTVSVPVTISGASDVPVTVHWATSDDTALAGTRYTSTSGSLSWDAGATGTQYAVVPVIDSPVKLGTQDFRVSLSSPVNATISQSSALVTITDNGTPSVAVTTGGALSVAEGGGSTTFSVSLTTQPAADVTVSMIAGSLLSLSSLSLTFTSVTWATPQVVTVTGPALGSISADGSSPISFGVSSADRLYANFYVPGITVTVTHVALPTLTILDTSASETSGSATVTVALSSAAPGPVSVHFATANGTATAGTNYTATSGTLSWGTSDSSVKVFTVPITNNPVRTGNLTVLLALSAPVNATIARTDGTLTILDSQTAGVSVTPPGQSTSVSEGGTVTAFTVVLSSQPAADVTVTPTASTLLGISPSVLTFTSQNWSTAQTVTLTGPPLGSIASDQTTPVSFAVASNDPIYGGIAVPNLPVTVHHIALPVLSIGDVSVDKLTGTATVTVSITGTPSASASVSYGTANSTATAGTDYTAATGTLNWSVGDTAPKTLSVTINPASTTRGNVSFDVLLTSPTNVTISRSAATVTIIDNTQPSVVLTQPLGSTTVVQGGAGSSFTLALASAPSANVSIAMSAGGLLAFSPSTVTFTPENWATPQSVTVNGPATGTLSVGANVAVAFAIASTDVAYANVAPPALTVAITVPVIPPPATFAATSVSVNESAGSATIPIAGGAPNSQVQYVTVSGTATAGVDYTATSGTLTWGALESGSKSVTVPLLNDSRNHPNRTFQLTLSNAVGGAIIVSTATITVICDNAAPQLAVGSTTVSETAGTVSVPVSLSSASDVAVSVHWATSDDTALAGTRYTASSGTLSWDAGASGTLYAVVPVINDPVKRGTQDFRVSLTSPTSATISQSSALVSITDNQSPSVVVATGGALSVAEGGGTTTFAVSLSTQPAANVTIAMTSGTLLSLSSSQLTFTPSNWAAAQTVTVTGPPLGSISTDQSSPIGFSVSSTDGLYNNIYVAGIAVAVTHTALPTLSVLDTSVSETSGSASITVALSAAAPGPVAVHYATANGTAVSGTNYAAASGTLHWAKSDSSPKTFTVPVVNNPVKTGNLTVLVSLSAPTNATIARTDGTLTILDSQTAAVVVTPPGQTTTVSEGGTTTTFTVVLSSQPAADVTVTPTASTLLGISPSVLTFTSQSWSTAQTVTLTGPPIGSISSTQTTPVSFAASSSDPVYNRMGVPNLPVTVNHIAPPVVSVDDVSVDKLTGNASVTVAISGTPTAAATVSYATANATAVAGTDYTTATGTLTWAVGDTAPKSISVAVNASSPTRGNVTFDVLLSGAVRATLGRNAATVTIIDNSQASVVLTQPLGSTSVVQGGTGSSFTLALGSAPSANVTVALSAGALLAFSPSSVTFTPQNWATPQSVSVTGPAAGTLSAGTSVAVAFAITSTDVAYAHVAPPTLSVAITVPSLAPVATFAVTSLSVNESAGSVQIPVAGGVPGAQVQYSTQDGTASAGVDYTATSGTLTWGPSESGGKAIVVPLLNDQKSHPSRAFTVVLSNPVGGPIVASTATITVNDDNPLPIVSAGDVIVPQASGTVSIPVTLVGASGVAVSVSWATSDGTAQAGTRYTASSGTLTWAPGTSSTKFAVVPLLTPKANLGTQDFRVSLSGAANATISQSSALVQVTDAVTPRVVVATSGPAAVTEGGGTSTFAVALASQPQSTVTVNLVSGALLSLSAPALTFTTADWATPQTVTITGPSLGSISQDTTSTVSLSAASSDLAYNGIYIDGIMVTVTHVALPKISVEDTAVSSGSSEAVVSVSLDTPPSKTVSVAIATSDGTAHAGANYTSSNTTLTWHPADGSSKSFTIPILGLPGNTDPLTFTASLASATNATIARAVGTVTILNRQTPSVSVTTPSGPIHLVEGGAPSKFRVVLSAAPLSDTTVTLSSDALLAPSPTVLLFTAANWSAAQTVTLTGPALGALPADETDAVHFTVASIDPSYNGLGVSDLSVTLTKATLPVLSISDIAVNRRAGAATVTVSPSAPSSLPVSVSYATIDGSAKSGGDYTAARGTLAWAPGDVAPASFTVALTNPAATVGDVAFQVLLTGAVNATLARTAATVDIIDSSTPHFIVTQPMGETVIVQGGRGAQFIVVLSSKPTADVTLTFGGNGLLTFYPPSVTFTPSMWNVGQGVDIVGPANGTLTWSTLVAVGFTVTTTDVAYASATSPALSVDVVVPGAPDGGVDAGVDAPQADAGIEDATVSDATVGDATESDATIADATATDATLTDDGSTASVDAALGAGNDAATSPAFYPGGGGSCAVTQTAAGRSGSGAMALVLGLLGVLRRRAVRRGRTGTSNGGPSARSFGPRASSAP